jgi:acyl phosphate:glycerol-3-phosphate acyltransferase
VMTAILVVAGYLAGSLPFGYWVGRAKGLDVRTIGSGNIGATNVWRALGWRFGLPVVLLDVAKAFVPALLGVALVDDQELTGVLAGAAAMLGHWRPLFLRFARGGKTVAAAGGVFFAVAPLVGLATLAAWIVVFVTTRYASVASILAAIGTPVLAWAFGEPWPVIVFAASSSAAVVLLHRANLRRLRAGTENRFRLRRRAAVGGASRAASPRG